MQQQKLTHRRRATRLAAFSIIFAVILLRFGVYQFGETHGHASTPLTPDRSRSDSFSQSIKSNNQKITVHQAVRNDVSRPLARLGTSSLTTNGDEEAGAGLAQLQRRDGETPAPMPAASAAVEQRTQGHRAAAQVVESFDGLGVGFEGPQGKANVRNPSVLITSSKP